MTDKKTVTKKTKTSTKEKLKEPKMSDHVCAVLAKFKKLEAKDLVILTAGYTKKPESGVKLALNRMLKSGQVERKLNKKDAWVYTLKKAA